MYSLCLDSFCVGCSASDIDTLVSTIILSFTLLSFPFLSFIALRLHSCRIAFFMRSHYRRIAIVFMSHFVIITSSSPPPLFMALKKAYRLLYILEFQPSLYLQATNCVTTTFHQVVVVLWQIVSCSFW